MRLLDWFKSWFRPKDVTSLNVFAPHEQLIYQYWDGQKTVKVDPMVLVKRIAAVRGELQQDLKVASANFALKGQSERYEAAMNTIREVFQVKPYANGGLTDPTALSLLWHFLAFEADLKKKGSPSPTPPEEPPPDSTPPSADVPRTPSSSPSGSTASGPPTDSATRSPPESPSPSA